MLEDCYKYYINNKETLLQQFPNKYVVIVGNSVVGAYDSDEEAYFDSVKKYEKGTFLMQLIQNEEFACTHTFHSNIVSF